MKKILLIFTGGTICSFGDNNNENRDIDINKSSALLLKNFKNSCSEYSNSEFEEKTVLNVLSENMTVNKWNDLLVFLKNIDYSSYKGVIIAHGTDNLAYTSCLVALLLSSVKVPVFLVSSNLPLNNTNANGNVNFKTAVELICNGISNGVFVVYRNTDNNIYLHKASHLRQCQNYSDDFESADSKIITNYNKTIEQIREENNNLFNPIELCNINLLINNVLQVRPYVGLDYSYINYEMDIYAIVHGLYHSATACVEIDSVDENYTSSSILYLLDKCRKHDIKLILEPSREGVSLYASMSHVMGSDAISIYGLTSEMVYVKTLLASAMQLSNEDYIQFMKSNICGEFIEGV